MMTPGKRKITSNESPASIAYVAQSFPDLTQTFIYREVSALERLGMAVATFAIWKKPIHRVSEEARHWIDKTRYALPVKWSAFFLSHLHFLLKHPQKYLKTAFFILTRPGESLKNRKRTFFHFCEAVYIAKDIQNRGIRHIHAHFSINAATVALVASRLLDISFSFTAHNIFFSDSLILRDKIREAVFIAAISEYTRQRLIDAFPDDMVANKIHIIRCGLEPDKFLPPVTKPPNENPIILFVAQLNARKGAPFLLEACKILVEDGYAFQCIIVGDGPQKALLERLARDLNLGSSVRIEGKIYQEDLKNYLEKADVFVLPCIVADDGDRDGIPVSLMEAMAMEVPCISTFVSGIPELIANGVSGLLVEEKNPPALAKALKKLLADSELRRQMGKRGRKKILLEFDVNKSARRLKKLFQRCLSSDV